MRRILIVFISLGLVSLFADMVYEGARSASGAFLEHLDAPPIASSIIGVGEFIGYVLRFVGAYIATLLGSSTAFWGLIVAGYALNVLLIPSLAFTSSWNIAVLVFLAERVGKGIRAPLRDVVLAEVTEGLGRGKGFGLHELMDQIGALTGPILFAAMLAYFGYNAAFLTLFIPGLLAMVFITSAWSLYPRIKSVSKLNRRITVRGLGRAYWFYTASMSLQALGFAHWAIISYFLKYWGVLGDHEIALVYAIAMGVDAMIALPIGYLYDRIKFRSLFVAPLFTSLVVPLILMKNPLYVLIASGIWGIVMGVSETIMRASIADILNTADLAIGYGLFGMIYGLSWSIGGFVITALTQISETLLITYVLITQVISIAMLYKLTKITAR